MILDDAIRNALPELRAEAEALMVDSCRIAQGGERVWDEDAGEWTTQSVTVYEGKCRVQTTLTNESNPNAGERNWTVQTLTVSVPMDVVGIEVGAKVEIITSEFDPDLPGRVFLVSALAHKTHMTARRFRVEEVTE